MSGELGDYVNKQQAEQAAVAAEQAAGALRTMPLNIFRTKCQCFDAQIFFFSSFPADAAVLFTNSLLLSSSLQM